MQRLNQQTLQQIGAEVSLPNYDRRQARAGIVHLGVGAFHRAHQAWYTEALLNRGELDWQIIGASLRSATVKDQLAAQDGLYTVVERDKRGETFQVVGALQKILVGPESPAVLLEAMADPTIHIVSLTITEKGYCRDASGHQLDLQHPDIAHDLNNIAAPKSAIGYIVAALDKRRVAGVDSFTPMSCDNLPGNGRILQTVVMQFAHQLDPELAAWIEAHTRFPCTMIDRIVPATTENDRQRLEQQLGLRDEGMVATEPFHQWVIEDNFCSARPAWERAGALVVADVEAYELMKLRLLNGSHSLLAYCGYLAGCETVSDVMNQPQLARLCQAFMDAEVTPTLKVPAGFDVDDYKSQLRERFANPALKHRTWQIAMDGSQKIPQRWLQTLQYQLDRNGPIDLLCLALAAWLRYVGGRDEAGQPIEVQDPMAAELKALWDAHGSNLDQLVKALLSIDAIFPEALAGSEPLQKSVVQALENIQSGGIISAVGTALSVKEPPVEPG